MFWKRTQERIGECTDRVQELQKTLESLKEQIHTGAQNNEQSMKQLSKTIQKHDMELEDLLESWESGSSRERELEQRAVSAEEQAEKLRELVCAGLALYCGIRRILLQSPEWKEPLAAIESQMLPVLRNSGLALTGKPGEYADPRTMDILSVEETDDPAKDRLVSEVYSFGLTEGSKVLQKAQVRVTRYREKPV